MAGVIAFVVLLAAVTTALGGLGATIVASAFLLALTAGTIGIARLLSGQRS